MRQLRVEHKMALFMTIVLIMMLGIGAMDIIGTRNMTERSKETYEEYMLPISHVNQIRVNNQEINACLLELLLADQPEAIAGLTDKIEARILNNDDLLSQLRAVPLPGSRLTNMINEYSALLPDYRTQRDQIIRLSARHQEEDVYSLYSGDFSRSLDKMAGLLTDTAELLREDSELHHADILSGSRGFSAFSIIVILVIWIVCAVIGLIIARSISEPLKVLQEQMKRAGEGDFTVSATDAAGDEIGRVSRSFNDMLENLRVMLAGASKSAGMILTSAEELAASAEHTARISQRIMDQSIGSLEGSRMQDAGDFEEIRAACAEQLTVMGEMAASAQSQVALAENLQKSLLRFRLK